MVCRLHKDLYGLKEAPRVRYERLQNYLVKIGFEKNKEIKICNLIQKEVKGFY